MKYKPTTLVLIACLAVASACLAQDAAPTATAPAATDAAAASPSPIVAPPAPVVTPTAPVATAAPATDGVIPLIQFVEAPLTAVIENLARQANMNYILDPRINYGQPGPDGKVSPQPSISIRWENLTAAQALNALLQNYDLQMTEDPKTKIARISPKDPTAPDPLVTQVIQLKFANPSNIVNSVQGSLYDKRSKAVADIRTSQLVVTATDKELVAINDLINRLDTQTKQVLIEARLIETSLNPTTSKGIDWTGTLQNQNVKFGNGSTFQNPPTPATITPGTTTTTSDGTVVVTAPIVTPGLPGTLSGVLGDPALMWNTANGFNPSTFFLNADGVSAALSFLNTDSDSKVLATPRAVTLDNEPAHLAVTIARPIFKTTAGTQGSPGGSEVTYTNLGTTLDVTPRISANNFVNLKVIPQVSTFVNTISKIVSGQVNQADVFAFRTIETQVLIPSGNTLVLGGLISDASTKGYIKVPILGDIPGIGLAFRKESKSRDQKNLIIFITPTIVQDSDYQPTTTDFMAIKPVEPSQKPWSAWDSGKPAIDWTKPSGGTSDK